MNEQHPVPKSAAERLTLPAVPPTGLNGRVVLGLLVTLGLLAYSWANTFSEMWLRWFPAWERMHNAPLMDRFTKGDSYYSHGPLVPLTSLILIYFIYKRVGLPVRRTTSSRIMGWVALVLFLLLHLLSIKARVTFVSGFALIGVLGALTVVWGGWPLLAAYWLPVAILVFMVPLPMEMIANLNFRLKFAAGEAAVWATNEIFNVPAVLDGSYVHLLPAADGTAKTLQIENVCSGLRSLISLTFFAALFAMVCRVRGGWRIFLLLMSVPVAILCNVVRITSMNVVAHYWSVAAAGEESWFHGFSGLMVFVLALVFLFGLEQSIVLAGKLLHRQWADPRILGYLDHLPRTTGATLRVWHPVALTLLVGTAVAGSIWAREIPGQAVSTVAAGAVPRAAVIAGRPYHSEDLQLDNLTLTILETDDYLYRRFSSSQAAPSIDLLIVFSPNNRKGTHPPEVCLEGGGDQVVRKAIAHINMPNRGDLALRELVSQRGTRLNYHLYVYKCGNRYTTDFTIQQATIFFNGLLGGNTAGALIRLTLPVVGQDVAAARRQALAAATALLPIVDKNLP